MAAGTTSANKFLVFSGNDDVPYNDSVRYVSVAEGQLLLDSLAAREE